MAWLNRKHPVAPLLYLPAVVLAAWCLWVLLALVGALACILVGLLLGLLVVAFDRTQAGDIVRNLTSFGVGQDAGWIHYVTTYGTFLVPVGWVVYTVAEAWQANRGLARVRGAALLVLPTVVAAYAGLETFLLHDAATYGRNHDAVLYALPSGLHLNASPGGVIISMVILWATSLPLQFLLQVGRIPRGQAQLLVSGGDADEDFLSTGSRTRGDPAAGAPPTFLQFVTHTGVTFRDVIGLDGAKRDVAEAIHLMEKPEIQKAHGIEPVRGILLHGPPGTGKTMFAKAAAGEFQKRFVAVSASELVGKYVGETEKHIRAAFVYARAQYPCILFIDEADALLRSRTLARNDWEVSRVTTFLTELDGIAGKDRAPIVILATNNLEALDAAVIRAGRIDRHVLVPLPDATTRRRLLEMELSKRNTASPFDVGAIVKTTEGWSSAGVTGLVGTAARLIYRENPKAPSPRPMTTKDLLAALNPDQTQEDVSPAPASAPTADEFVAFLAAHPGTPRRFIIDGMNVAKTKAPVDLAFLEDVTAYLDRQGFDYRVFVDAPLYGVLTSRPEQQKRLDGYVRSGSWTQAPKGVEADRLILDWASQSGGYVISNDDFRDYATAHPWLLAEPHRKVRVAPRFDGSATLIPSTQKEEQRRRKERP